ncbi:bifunctional homocysteine S-methyltransferase/methylenetetrahydrofolate reductase [candidate division CSSED10-310 bacterium]|uniref:Bifunctional homocysteine S-methyltransferase/methylenetetrahydrofolate reductase n=1 Tax=candidate division CSSED10-310 bacterium TaxID=2855610 RepID=A0ABV6YW02_UNCC1
MVKDFRDRLDEGIIICDGAMGTMLYARGIYINQCFDALNLNNPDLVQQIHQDYLNAGAEILETNTFGANYFKLAAYGLEGKLSEINRLGAEIARKAGGNEVYIAGSLGPLGKPMAPIGNISSEQAYTSFYQQAAALVEGGCDLLILETFTSITEIELAIDAVREVTNLPIIAQVTFTDLEETLMGETPEQVAFRLSRKSIDVLGANCSQGPAGILTVIERMGQSSSLPLSAQPNAGMPRMVEGRFIYLSSPEYMAEYAKRLIQAGVSIIGGCCGTTSTHIKAITAAVRALQPRKKHRTITIQATGNEHIPAAKATAQKSPLAAKLGKKLIKVAEINPPRGTDASKAVQGAQLLKEAGFDGVNIPDGPRASARMSPLALSKLISDRVGIEVILHYCCRDRNILGMQSDLLGIYALDLRNLLLITGDPPKLGDYPDATAVFDVDSIGLVRIVQGLNRGYDLTGKSVGQPTSFLIGVGANPGALKFEHELERLKAKVDNGAEMILTQPIFDLDRFKLFLHKIESFRRPVLMGLLPLASYRNAEFLHNEVPGMTIPAEIRERLRKAETKKEAQRIGIEIARESLLQARDLVEGVYIMPPFGRYEAAIEVLHEME